MPRIYSHRISESRAIQIYRWVLAQEGTFKASDIPGWKETAENKEARASLVRRGLIAIVNDKWPRTYRLGRRVEPERCLDIDRVSAEAAGIKHYRVPIFVAEKMGGIPNLIDYAI